MTEKHKTLKSLNPYFVLFRFSVCAKREACLLEAGYDEETRHTIDIDANWYSDVPPSAEQMVESLQKAIFKNNIDLNVKLYRMYGEGRSAGFELADSNTDEVLFTMDVDANRPVPPTKIYEVAGVNFCGVSPIQMIADKVAAISTDKVFRRIKDVVDLYYLSNVFDFDRTAVLVTLKNSDRKLENFNGFLKRAEELRHSYEKFRFAGDVNKPPFEEVYRAVKIYIKDILPKEKRRDHER